MITPWSLQVLELYFVHSYPKNFYQKFLSLKSLWEKQFWPSPVDRTVDRWQSWIALSVDRAVDRHAPLCMCAHRSTDRSTESNYSALFFLGRPDRSTDRETHSLFGTLVDRLGRPPSQRSKIRPLAIDRPGRPIAVRNFWQFPTAIFSDWFCVGFPPMTLLTLVSQFSSPINRGSVLQLK